MSTDVRIIQHTRVACQNTRLTHDRRQMSRDISDARSILLLSAMSSAFTRKTSASSIPRSTLIGFNRGRRCRDLTGDLNHSRRDRLTLGDQSRHPQLHIVDVQRLADVLVAAAGAAVQVPERGP